MAQQTFSATVYQLENGIASFSVGNPVGFVPGTSFTVTYDDGVEDVQEDEQKVEGEDLEVEDAANDDQKEGE